ncbi:MAG: glutamine--fructose-6-phosphate transaminase (isomerizing) [Candidatus Levyibacteriota bacterium]
MCGIYGFVSNEEHSANEILEGLKLLEYRGYDSWGVAVKSGKQIFVDKNIGKIGSAKLKPRKSNLGIGHTRWATHGGVTIKNAHPHLDCKQNIAVVHNGIIENYQELKQDLIKKGHRFVSETDTEVFAHLVEEFLKKDGFATAVRKAFNVIQGLNAIVVMSSVSSEIVAAKTGSPLIVGVGNNGFFISSDAVGIYGHATKALFLKDNEMVVLGKNLQLISLPRGNKLTPEFEKIESKAADKGKGEYKHFMLKEIMEQPAILQNIAENYQDIIADLSGKIKNAYGTYFVGAGTAFYACLAGTYLFSKIAKLHVNTAPASEFNYLEDFLTPKSLVIGLSQSGETIDVIEPLQIAKKSRAKIIAITNTKGSTIYRMADEKILLGAGTEKAVASTKAYLAKLSILLMLAFAMKGQIGKAQNLLGQAAKEIQSIFSPRYLKQIQMLAKVMQSKEHIFIIGRGMSYPSALEGALKIREVSYLHAEGIAGGELKHGPIALIEKGTPCIVFAPNDETYAAIMSNAMEIKARGGVIIGISYKNSEVFDYFLQVLDLQDATILTQIVPLQLLAYYIAVNKGFDPDKPRNLAKSVTVK